MKGLSNILTVFTVFILLFLCVTPASATYMSDITYDYVDNGSGNYNFNFTVNNTSTDLSAAPLDFFMIDFDADSFGSYSNIVWTNDNEWYCQAFKYDPSFSGLPGSVFADDAAIFGGGGGIAQGGFLSGFSVQFDHSGTLDPSQQLFPFIADFGTNLDGNGIDMYGYWVTEEVFGTTSYVGGANDSSPIPEPGTMILLGIGLVGLAGFGKKKIKK